MKKSLAVSTILPYNYGRSSGNGCYGQQYAPRRASQQAYHQSMYGVSQPASMVVTANEIYSNSNSQSPRSDNSANSSNAQSPQSSTRTHTPYYLLQAHQQHHTQQVLGSAGPNTIQMQMQMSMHQQQHQQHQQQQQQPAIIPTTFYPTGVNHFKGVYPQIAANNYTHQQAQEAALHWSKVKANGVNNLFNNVPDTRYVAAAAQQYQKYFLEHKDSFCMDPLDEEDEEDDPLEDDEVADDEDLDDDCDNEGCKYAANCCASEANEVEGDGECEGYEGEHKSRLSQQQKLDKSLKLLALEQQLYEHKEKYAVKTNNQQLVNSPEFECAANLCPMQLDEGVDQSPEKQMQPQLRSSLGLRLDTSLHPSGAYSDPTAAGRSHRLRGPPPTPVRFTFNRRDIHKSLSNPQQPLKISHWSKFPQSSIRVLSKDQMLAKIDELRKNSHEDEESNNCVKEIDEHERKMMNQSPFPQHIRKSPKAPVRSSATAFTFPSTTATATSSVSAAASSAVSSTASMHLKRSNSTQSVHSAAPTDIRPHSHASHSHSASCTCCPSRISSSSTASSRQHFSEPCPNVLLMVR